MTIPDFEFDGTLPVGIHVCTLEEVASRYGHFGRTDVRLKLTERLRAYVEEARRTRVVVWLGIDGSYITREPEPGDIDLVVALRADHDFAAEIPPFTYNVVSRRRVKKLYDFDILAAPEGSAVLATHLEFFQTTRGGKPKGLLKVTL
jgi:hypothetical protein